MTLLSSDLTEPPRDAFLNTKADEGWPELSPDGRWLAYASDESGAHGSLCSALSRARRQVAGLERRRSRADLVEGWQAVVLPRWQGQSLGGRCSGGGRLFRGKAAPAIRKAGI